MAPLLSLPCGAQTRQVLLVLLMRRRRASRNFEASTVPTGASLALTKPLRANSGGSVRPAGYKPCGTARSSAARSPWLFSVLLWRSRDARQTHERQLFMVAR